MEIPFWIIILCLALTHVICLVVEEPINEDMYRCLELETRNMTVSDYPSAGIMHTCVQKLLVATMSQRFHHNVSEEGLAWIHSLVRKYANHRHKRQSPSILRRRREIRMLNDDERMRLFNAINALKQSGRYDTLATFHQGMALDSAHNGPNFMSWHRIFLVAFEEALIEVDPGVSLAYWDSSIDFDTDDPIRSVVWTSQFFGNGDGAVVTGPFANWVTPDGAALTRAIGSFGTSLMQKRLIANIIGLGRDNGRPLFRTAEISVLSPNNDFPWRRANILERQHDGVHSWVSGQMNGLATAAFDPVFFFHHCFVDYVWEMFREKQARFGIDPTADYPEERFLLDNPNHMANNVMDGFPMYTNIDGYSNRFTNDIYTYERSPQCPNCGSPYLVCQWWTRTCASVDRSLIDEDNPTTSASGVNPAAQAFSGASVPTAARAMADQQGPLETGPTFQSSFVDPRARNRPTENAPRRDGLGAALGARTDGGTGTGINFGSALLQRAETRAMANRAVRFGGAAANIASGMNGVDPASFNSIAVNLPFVNGGQPSMNVGSLSMTSFVSPVPAENQRSPFTQARGPTGFSLPSNPFGNLGPAQVSSAQPSSMSSVHQSSAFNEPLPFAGPMGNIAPMMFGNPNNFRRPPPRASSAIDMGIQNTFAMDGNSDINDWAFMPIRIVRRRPDDDVFYDGRIVREGRLQERGDLYTPNNYRRLNRYFRTGKPATYPKCGHVKSGAAKIFVEVNGISYSGHFKDYAMIDERMPVSEGYTYVGFRNPVLGTSRAYVHAYDTSGRVCQPRCLVRGTSPPVYLPCSGAVRMTPGLPRMYGNSYGEAVLGKWDFQTDLCPKSYDGEVFMSFYCDYADGWPWRECKSRRKSRRF